MKNLKFLAGIISIVIAFTFSSCTNEPIDPAINLDNFNQTCAVPTSFQVGSFINNNSVSLSWVAGAGETGWTIEYGLVGFALGTGATVTSQTTTITVAGLNSSNSYSFYLKSNCSSTSSSSWVGPVTIQAIVVNPNCVNPSNLTAVRNATLNTNVDLAWTAGGTETQWEIQYGLTGFAIGSGTIVSSTTSTKQISNILTTSSYDFYVRAKCSATENSGWIGPIVLNSIGGAVSGDYFPMAINNYWNYDNGSGTKSFKLISIESINSLNYYKLDNPFLTDMGSGFFTPSDAVCHVRKQNGEYTQRTYLNKPETATSPGISIQAFDAIFLKDYLNVGDSYTQNINQVTTTSFMGSVNTTNSTITYVISIEEKNVSLTVGSQTFSNVIKTKTISSNSTGIYSISYNWYAKNIGPIKQINYSSDGVTINSQISILNYILN